MDNRTDASASSEATVLFILSSTWKKFEQDDKSVTSSYIQKTSSVAGMVFLEKKLAENLG